MFVKNQLKRMQKDGQEIDMKVEYSGKDHANQGYKTTITFN